MQNKAKEFNRRQSKVLRQRLREGIIGEAGEEREPEIREKSAMERRGELSLILQGSTQIRVTMNNC